MQEKKGEGAFLYQIITDKDESVKIAQVQTMLEQSFISADLILSEVSGTCVDANIFLTTQQFLINTLHFASNLCKS